MSLARIQHVFHEAHQRRKLNSPKNGQAARVDGEPPKAADIPQISLSWQSQTSSLSYPCPEPLPLANIGALVFSLSGYSISKSAESFNVVRPECTSQVLVVVIENMSMDDLSEKPNMLNSFRRIVAENGFSVVVRPSIADAHTTGSDLSQVELSFSKDASILKLLVSETSRTRKLKSVAERPLNGRTSRANSLTSDHSFSDYASNDDTSQDDCVDISRHLRDFTVRFSHRHKPAADLRPRHLMQGSGHPKKRHSFPETGSKPGGAQADANASVVLEDGPPSNKISKFNLKAQIDKLDRLKQERADLVRTLKRLQAEDPASPGASKRAHQIRRARQRLRMNEEDYRRVEEEWDRCKNASNSSADAENAEKAKGRDDLLRFLNQIQPQIVENWQGLTPVGTVLPSGNLDRSRPERFDRCLLLLSLLEMKANGFNLDCAPSKRVYAPVTSRSRMFGVDCEMCLTSKMANELTRVTLVDEDGIVLIDEFVKPRAKIINYLTPFSGITPQMLEGVTTRREDVVKKLDMILPPDAILVGHSLDSDLKALGIIHPYCIDTSVIYSVKGGHQKSKLKVLMKTFLNEDIQTAGEAGHSSAEDSFSALKLVLLKLQHDISFGDIDMNPSFEWNGINYRNALIEAMNIVTNERRRQIIQSSWVRPPAFKPTVRTRLDVDQALLVNMSAEERTLYLDRKKKFDRLVKARRRQETVIRNVQKALREQDTVEPEILRELRVRLKVAAGMIASFEGANGESSEANSVPISQDDSGNNSFTDQKQTKSLVVLLAKQRFLKTKIGQISRIPNTPDNKSKARNIRNRIVRLREESRAVAAAIAEVEHQQKSEAAAKDAAKNGQDEANGVDEDPAEAEDSDGEEEDAPFEDDEDATKEATDEDILKMVEEADRGLRAIKAEEQRVRKLLAAGEAAARKVKTEMRIEKKHHDDETLARRIQSGEVSMDDVFNDDAVMHRFVKYQLFVQRKNDEFARKRGHSFGTVVLERLYLNMFSAWRMAKKRAVVVAEEEVAAVHYDGVKIMPPESPAIGATVRTARRSLAHNDLVVSHLLYDDVHENEAEIDSGLCQLWDAVKRAGVVVVILEGTYHFKQLGLGLGMIAIKK